MDEWTGPVFWVIQDIPGAPAAQRVAEVYDQALAERIATLSPWFTAVPREVLDVAPDVTEWEWEYAVRDHRPPGYIAVSPLDPTIPSHLNDIRKLYGDRPIIRRRPAGSWEEVAWENVAIGNYTPSTVLVRDWFAQHGEPDSESPRRRKWEEAFDRWLAGVIWEAQADELERMADDWAADPDSWGDNEKDYRNELRDRAAALREKADRG